MSNLLRKSFFTLPLDLGRRMSTMSDPALRIYVCLFQMGNQHSAPTIEIPAFLLEDWTGLSESSVAKGAKELSDAGLVLLSAGPHRTTRYTLTDPATIREAGERQEPATKKKPAQTIKLFVGDALPTPAKFRGTWRAPAQQGRSSRTKREIAAARKATKAPAESASKPFCPPTGPELFGAGADPVPCLAVNMYVNSMENVRKNHGTDPSKSLKTQSDNSALLKHSEEGISESSFSEARKVKVVERKVVVVSDENPDAEPVPRWEKEPVILALQKVFGARIVAVIDLARGDQREEVNLSTYEEWVRRQVNTQLGPGKPWN
jgi:hypothetical protein